MASRIRKSRPRLVSEFVVQPEVSDPAQDEVLELVLARLGAHVHNNCIPADRVERAVARASSPSVTYDAIAAALIQRGVSIDLGSERGATSRPPGIEPRQTDDRRTPQPPTAAAMEASMAAGRQLLADDRATRDCSRRLLTSTEATGLSILARGGIGAAKDEFKLSRLSGQRRAAADSLVLHNQRLVWDIARGYDYGALPLEDLSQHGVIGLIRAVEKFDPTMGFMFSTYATHWIHQAIRRALANEARLIRLPVHVVDTLQRLERTRRSMWEDLGRPPTVHELAVECHMTPAEVRRLSRLGQDVLSLDMPFEDNGATLGDILIVHDSSAAFNKILEDERDDALAAALNTLTEREADVLRYRFGLADGTERTLREIGDVYGVTRERIRQIEEKALKKLRAPSRSAALRDWA